MRPLYNRRIIMSTPRPSPRPSPRPAPRSASNSARLSEIDSITT